MASEEQNKQSPSPFQIRTMWTAITALSIVVIAIVSVGVILLGGKILGYLQPILVPIVVAGIIAYLLQPIITWMRRRFRWRHRTCMLIVFFGFILFVLLLIYAVVVPSFGQAKELIEDRDTYQAHITEMVRRGMEDLKDRFNNPIAQKYYDRGIQWVSEEGPDVGQKIGSWIWARLMGAFGFFGYMLGLILVPIYLFYFLKESHIIKRTWSDYLPLRASKFKDEVVDTLHEINQYLISFFRGQMVVSLIDGALIAFALSLLGIPYALLIGVFLAILGLIPYIGNLLVMIPAALIAFSHFGTKEVLEYPIDSEVKEGQVTNIKLSGDRAPKKRRIVEVEAVTKVSVEHEGKIVEADASYADPAKPETKIEPGQALSVRMANGVTLEKTVIGTGRSVKQAKVLKNAWTFLSNVWVYPLIVIGIFILLQQINGLVTAPKIVGDSVGLHPLTVIFSVLFWSFLLGGLLGALLAVPLTASIKVLFRRYIWVKRIEPRMGPVGPADSAAS